ncbi:energy-coupled thiamine transporter ThiT [Sutcliffiella rhizosphaerae]|uniref:Thiamine transporter ThiT n=1 Tax=Sutcliffiella rhizosphaerae TaxID=2880967 RepID=A0ABM8YMB6_9BACI|nr:energy-coupled thiamine transporter ThiT [Sutcliffiella rhizosphaerae]CAG9620893.1 Thiamine transporter ThiT [Sutcliffiella rhizosphaerae]
MKKTNTLFLAEVAIFGAMAYLLDLLAGALSLKIWASGGSISISMVPVFIMAFRWGLKGGLLTGFILGFFQILMGQIIGADIRQILLDYIVAFTGLGLAGIFAKQVTNAVLSDKLNKIILFVTVASFIGCFVRFLAHYAAGIIFFGHFAPEGQPVWLYSLLYNGSYMLPSFIIATIVTILLIRTVPRIFTFNKPLT